MKQQKDLFRLCPPPPVRYAPPSYRARMSLHSSSLCKNIARASGVANNMHPLSWGGGGTNGKDPNKNKTGTIEAVRSLDSFSYQLSFWGTIIKASLNKPTFFLDLFYPPPQLSEHKSFMTPGARGIFLHRNLLYNNI